MSLDVGEPGVERGDTGVTEGNKKKQLVHTTWRRWRQQPSHYLTGDLCLDDEDPRGGLAIDLRVC